VCVGAGALAGAVLALVALDPHFILGTGAKWVRPDNDFIAYLVAWNYYVVDSWRFPLFSLPNMGYPEGGSVLFNDALPVAALPTKVLYHLSGLRINPFGWWILLTYVLQGAMAARLVCAVGVRSVWASAAAAVLAVCNTSFMWRMGHTALSSHFLVLWALALHFESLRRGRARIVEFCVLLALALLVNSYLFVMVAVLEGITLVALGVRGQLSARELRRTALGLVAVVAIGLIAGYGVLFVNPTTMKGVGFGFYSWNLVGLLLPADGVFGFLAGVTRDATGGQYEGEAYVGRGVLFLLAVCLFWAPRRVLGYARTYRVLCVTLLALAAYAASNRVYVGSTLLLSYYLPGFVIDLCNYFRATGRFIGPLAYCLTVLPVACVFRWWRPVPAAVAAVLAVSLQLWDARAALEDRRIVTAQSYVDLIDTPRIDGWLRQHQRLWQYPSWACGGLGGSKRSWGNLESNRELQVQLAAARAGIPTNSVYTSRLLKNCSAELAWQAHPQLDDNVLYVLGSEAVQASSTLSNLARSNACVTLEWGVVCSLKWSRMAADNSVGSPSAIRK
jgi:hypothetical protein